MKRKTATFRKILSEEEAEEEKRKATTLGQALKEAESQVVEE